MLKQLLFGMAAFVWTSSVMAADITNPFYLPKKGEIGSTTSVAFERGVGSVSMLNGRGRVVKDTSTSYDRQVSEKLQYGITDSFALMGTVGNSFNKLRTKSTGGSSGSLDTDNNLYFSAGFGWNILKGPTRLELQAQYTQAHGGYKSVTAELQAGYQFKTFLPYVSIAEELPINQPSGENKPGYAAKVGIYQGLCEVWALDTGIRWLHDELYEQRGFQAEAEASYYLTPKAALSIYGTYLFDGKGKYDSELRDKSLGLRLRWFI